MNGYLWVALGAVIGLMVPFLFLRRRQGLGEETGHGAPVRTRPERGSAAPVEARPKPPRGFHAVTLKPCPNACAAVHAITGQRFLSSEAPALPLAGCDQQRCDCTYGHWSDRRDRGNRRSGWDTFAGFAQSLVQGDRRNEARDRRNRR